MLRRAVALPPLLAELAREPDRAGILLDVDGVLAPIVADPAESRVPDETRAELRRILGKYALVGVLTGRTAEQARAIVGVDGIDVIGEHGLDLAPAAEDWVGVLDRFSDREERVWPVERKRFTRSFHFRTADDPVVARAFLEDVAERARADGLVARWGRMVLEVRPPIDANKGTALAHLLERKGIRRAMFAGDDDTDLDGFGAMAQLELGVRIAVASPEGPRALVEAADLVVDGPDEFLALLREL
jgi:trehalose 6-phosphate phosphatase